MELQLLVFMDNTTFEKAHNVLVQELESKSVVTFVKDNQTSFIVFQHLNDNGILQFVINKTTKYPEPDSSTFLQVEQHASEVGTFKTAHDCIVALAELYKND